MLELEIDTSREDLNEGKKSNRLSNIIVFFIIIFIVVLVWIITSVLYRSNSGVTTVISKAKQIDIKDIKSAKLVKDYNEYETIDSFDYVEFGTYNGKKLQWIVLKAEKGEALILSKYVLRSMPFANKTEKGFTEDWWNISEIKKWLNNEFYNETFDSDEKNKIVEKGKGPFGALDKVRVTILDNKEIGNLLGTENKVIISSHAKTRLLPGIVDNNISKNNDYVSYWTKTIKKDRVSVINYIGELNDDGYKPTESDIGIRPAIYIKY